MKFYTIKYSYDGFGEVNIGAKNKAEAEKKFYDGDFEEKDDSKMEENFFIDSVELLT